jgi:uncharacterized repeat protein (TIGR03803 family)
VQDGTGNFYGTTALGGANSGGTVFKITPGGQLTTLYSFCSLTDCADGNGPAGGLVHATNGNFYGETSGGGTVDCGVIFKITPEGKLTTLFAFDGTDGCDPSGGLIQASNEDFYGVAAGGGTGDMCLASENCGTVFKMTAAAQLTTLHDFCTTVACSDGAQPVGALVQGTDGNLYGTTYGYSASGPANAGTIFEINPQNTFTTLLTFDGTNGEYPSGGLLQATNGTFYGTTLRGGGTATAQSSV